MRPLRHLRVYLAAGIAYAGLIIYLTLTATPPAGPDLPQADKLEHLLAYALLMGWFGQLAVEAGLRLRLLLGFVLMGAGLEVLQGLGGVRQMELADGLANAAGAALGAWLTRGKGGEGLARWEGRD